MDLNSNEADEFDLFSKNSFPGQFDSCKLVLGLSYSPDYRENEGSSGVNKRKELANLFAMEALVPECDSTTLKLGLSIGNQEYHSDTVNGRNFLNLVVDEGSTSAKGSSCLLSAPRTEFSSEPSGSTFILSHEISDNVGSSERSHGNHSKKCGFNGCSKGARGASGLCIAHGGGQRCQKQGCNKGAESRTAYCKAHGGGKRCQELGCTKSAEGKTELCIAHGGGRRCGHSGCAKAARGRSGLCIKHGGGKRCTVEGCFRSAEGLVGLCISHGGGRRCQFPRCEKGAQGRTIYCKAHGGGRRCTFDGCSKGAEGRTSFCKGHGGGKRCLFEGGGGTCPKSVHGGTDFCVAHGGGKRCVVSGCTKSARGRTDCCVKHGGGKRCVFEGCGKSAQGSTDMCKAHGGGKRCSWDGGCEKFARGRSGMCAAHGVENEGASSRMSCVESSENPRRRILQCSMPDFSERCSVLWGEGNRGRGGGGGLSSENNGFVVPEGRVHGGGLMSMLGGSLDSAIKDGRI